MRKVLSMESMIDYMTAAFAIIAFIAAIRVIYLLDKILEILTIEHRAAGKARWQHSPENILRKR